jgi:uncharacterized protein
LLFAVRTVNQGVAMRSSMFNVRVPLPNRDEVFLMNTLTDAQLLVSADVAALLDRFDPADDEPRTDLGEDERQALAELRQHGFLAASYEAEREALDRFFADIREDTSDLRVTVLTTLQCNFACNYCIQGDHGDYNRHATRMSMATAAAVADWIEARLDTLGPERLVLTFFGGEPLLNLPVLYYLAERLSSSARERAVTPVINVITNGLLLSADIVDRLVPCGLNGVKVTLDGDRDAHNRARPLRGGQGTFDRIIRNLREVAGKCRIAIGGNFDVETVEHYPALLDFLRAQDFADAIGRVSFKPVIRARPAAPKGVIPLTALAEDGKPLGGTCMTSVGSGTGSPCDSCHFVDDKMTWLREETRQRGFATSDGVHMGPCELHRRHAYTLGPDGAIYACPGFTGDPTLAVGNIDGRTDPRQQRSATEFERHAPWKACGDCSFIPVCGGGCSVAAHTELNDMHAPACHKSSLEAALVSLAHDVAASA